MAKKNEPETSLMFDLGEPAFDKKLKLGKDGLTSTQLKAIKWYAESHRYQLKLSNPPSQMHFVTKYSKSEVTVTLDTILDEYNEWNKEDQKRRADERKRAKEAAKKPNRRVI